MGSARSYRAHAALFRSVRKRVLKYRKQATVGYRGSIMPVRVEGAQRREGAYFYPGNGTSGSFCLSIHSFFHLPNPVQGLKGK